MSCKENRWRMRKTPPVTPPYRSPYTRDVLGMSGYELVSRFVKLHARLAMYIQIHIYHRMLSLFSLSVRKQRELKIYKIEKTPKAVAALIITSSIFHTHERSPIHDHRSRGATLAPRDWQGPYSKNESSRVHVLKERNPPGGVSLRSGNEQGPYLKSSNHLWIHRWP